MVATTPMDADRLTRDVWRVVYFCCRRRSRHADVREACRRVLRGVDEDALALLLDAIEHRGSCDATTVARVARLRAALAAPIPRPGWRAA